MLGENTLTIYTIELCLQKLKTMDNDQNNSNIYFN
jgi:hypothetical protein